MGANKRPRLAWALVLFGISFFVAPIQADEGIIRTGCYVFEPVRSTIVQTGGFAGVHWTYAVEGRFCLIVDPDAATARFERIDANAVDVSEPERTLDPNMVFNLTALAGDVAGETIEFAGQTDDGSSVHLTLAFADHTVHLTGQTTPPPNSADFFLFSIDALATRKYAGGTGDPNTPYLIATAEQMNAIGTHPDDWDKHFQLTADIDLSAFDGKDGRPAFNIIASDPSVPFRGTFDGGGHTIAGFSYEVRQADHIALFGVVADPNTRIENLTLTDPNVKVEWGQHTAALVAHLREGTLSNCHARGGAVEGMWYVGGLLGASGYSEPNGGTLRTRATIVNCSYEGSVLGGFTMIGGLAGRDFDGVIYNCYTAGEVSGEYDTGGLIGDSTFSRIVSSYSTCTVVGGTYVAGLVGRGFAGDIIQCYATGPVTGDHNTGGLLTDVFDDSTTVLASFWDMERSGQATSAGGEGRTTAEMQDPQTFIEADWDFVGLDNVPSDIWAEPEGGGYPILWWQLPELPELPFAGGTGSENDPYLVASPEHLNHIGHNPRLMGAHFRLTEDLDFDGVVIVSIGSEEYPFGGTFDGADHTISNLTITSEASEPVGLFSAVLGTQAEVRNVILVDPRVEAPTTYGVGTLIGQIGQGTVRNCRVENGRVIGGTGVGGLTGLNGWWDLEHRYIQSDTINCHVNASVRGLEMVGGVVGINGWLGHMARCSFSGEVSGIQDIGGLAGASVSASVADCLSAGTVSGERCTGGLLGINSDATARGCFSTATVMGETCVGGFSGVNYGTIDNCYAAGDTAGNTQTGGLVGLNGIQSIWEETPGIISKCYASGMVISVAAGGGLVGAHGLGTISSCFWDTQASGWTTSPAGTGLTTAEMQAAATFLDAGWDFVGETSNGTDDVWWILEGQDYPRLWWERDDEASL